jgi:hypothetical protein
MFSYFIITVFESKTGHLGIFFGNVLVYMCLKDEATGLRSISSVMTGSQGNVAGNQAGLRVSGLLEKGNCSPSLSKWMQDLGLERIQEKFGQPLCTPPPLVPSSVKSLWRG